MNDIAIKPTTMKVMPRPRNAGGTFEYCIFSRTAARATIASNQPIPEPSAYTTASVTLPMNFGSVASRPIRCCMKSEAPMIAQFTAISGKKIPSDA